MAWSVELRRPSSERDNRDVLGSNTGGVFEYGGQVSSEEGVCPEDVDRRENGIDGEVNSGGEVFESSVNGFRVNNGKFLSETTLQLLPKPSFIFFLFITAGLSKQAPD